MQVDFEKAITKLTERWEEMTEGEKPIYVELKIFWPKRKRGQYVAYISCHALEKHQSVMFQSFTEAAKWIVSEITAMIESEFYKQKNADKHEGESDGEFENFDEIDWKIINLKSHGLKDREIADVIHFSPKTVKKRLLKLYERLDVHNNIQMLRKLNELGVDVWNIGRGSSGKRKMLNDYEYRRPAGKGKC